MKARVTITMEYEVDLKNYPKCKTLAEACKADEQSYDDNPVILLDILSGCDDVGIKVEPVE